MKRKSEEWETKRGRNREREKRERLNEKEERSRSIYAPCRLFSVNSSGNYWIINFATNVKTSMAIGRPKNTFSSIMITRFFYKNQ